MQRQPNGFELFVQATLGLPRLDHVPERLVTVIAQAGDIFDRPLGIFRFETPRDPSMADLDSSRCLGSGLIQGSSAKT
jgi:hypothetical protein